MDDVRATGLCGEGVVIGRPPPRRLLPWCIVPSVHGRLRWVLSPLVVVDHGVTLNV